MTMTAVGAVEDRVERVEEGELRGFDEIVFVVGVVHHAAPATWSASTTRATTSRSTSFFFLRAVSRRAAVASPVEVPHAAGGGLVGHGDGVGGEEVAITAGPLEAHADVLGGVLGAERVDVDAPVQARVERAVAAKLEAVAQLGQADQDQRKQGAAVPLVVEQDVQVVERVLVQEMALVEEEDRVDPVATEILHVGRDGVEDCCRRRRGRQAERDAHLAVEVAAAERDVVGNR